ncbi:PREDICTED: uncharacterized protein LOC109151977 [Ipomoea nil]|uniref:uncharacterized protein LOC109151977 n=1 Tax=Ipomoea nil TaxID=35883 RepID=UPI00090179CE|nr:PREDICTED: uncharacterized protein LOC109151977 [Ipomoea nil]
MSWALPSVNTNRQQSSSSLTHPIATENPIPIPNPNPTATSTNVANSVHFDPSDSTSLYFLHANESPALELVSSVLDGSNYHEWARTMKIALSSKNKLGFVNGMIKMPSSDDRKFFFWERCNNMVVTWIARVLSPTIARSVLWIDTAEGVWLDLQKRFSKQAVFRIAKIQARIYQTKQDSSTVNEYFTRLKLLWDELSILRPAPACICPQKCKCSDNYIGKAVTNFENDMLCAFLIGLDDKYTGTRNQIMLMRPLPDAGEAFSMISQQERQFYTSLNNPISFLGHSADNQTGSAMLTRGDRQYSNNKPKVVCSYCGFTGHSIDKCYKKHGYPPRGKRTLPWR